jgi:tetratricopeptide (TPR) repeat protein/KaiC/GvpD/RAD55 family RecA-like ATPase
MKFLKEAVDRAIQGEGGLVLLHGEAGIGKTRLARELRAYAQLHGMRVLYGRCPALFRMDGVPPYILWKEVIKDYLETCTLEQLDRVIGFYPAEVAKLVPELSQRLRTIPQSFQISPEQEQNRLFEAVSQFITNISKETPLLVVLDDLQWTDPSSLLLLHYLARGVQKTSLLLLGAYRSTDIDAKHPLSPVLTELNRERLPQSVSLKRMSLDDISEMIKQTLEQDDIPEEFHKMVYEKTKGNPFFAEEVVKSLKDQEVIYREGNKWAFKEISKIEFPETVKNVLSTRFSRLDDECQNVLTLASFIGNDFTLEAMCALTGIEENELLELMERLLKTGLIKEREVRGEGVCSFADILVRDVVYEGVSLLKRKKLHGVVGCALEEVYAAKIDEHFGELAYHFLESGNKEKALDYFLKAGEKAAKIYAHNEALSYFQRALELLERKEGSVEQKARVAESLGDIKGYIGETEARIEYWDKSLVLWDQLGDKKGISRLHVKMARVFWDEFGDKEKASEHHSMALEILEKEPESVELASLYEDISHMLWRTGKATDASVWTKKALELAEKLGYPEVLAESYNDLGALSMNSGEFEKAFTYYEQGLRIAVEKNCTLPAIRLYRNLCVNYFSTGEFKRTFETAQKGSELARKAGDVRNLLVIDFALAGCYAYMGELEKAISMFEDLLVLAKRIRSTTQVADMMWALGACYLYLGEFDRALRYLTEALDTAKKVGEYQYIGASAVLLGELFMEMEDYAEAEKYFKEGDTTWENAGDAGSRLTGTYPALSRLYLKKGEIWKAEELIEKSYGYVAKTRNIVDLSYIESVKGMLLREQKSWEQSIQHFEKSFQGYKSMNAQKWYIFPFAELLYEYGLAYLERNEEGDKEKANELLNQAFELWQRTGARKKVEKIRSIMTREETAHRTVPESETTARILEGVRGSIATGYTDLDELLYGGIPPDYAVVLTSPSCDERDLLVKSFLETGAKKGEVTFYATIDPGLVKPLAEEFQSNFYLFVCNPQVDTIVKEAPNVSKLKGVENLTDISIALTSAIRKLDPSPKGPRRICIGLVSDVLLQHHAVQTRRWLTGLVSELRSNGFTTLAVMDPEMHPSQEVRAVLDLFEGQIDIYEKETEKGSEKFLKIKKMANQRYLKDELLLKEEDMQR